MQMPVSTFPLGAFLRFFAPALLPILQLSSPNEARVLCDDVAHNTHALLASKLGGAGVSDDLSGPRPHLCTPTTEARFFVVLT